MDDRPAKGRNGSGATTAAVLWALAAAFAVLAAAFGLGPAGQPRPRDPIPLVDPSFLSTATNRRSYADLVRAKEDLSDFDCYACHEKGRPPVLRFDERENLIVPREHADIVMGHGEHGRNNNCFNCHNENNLELLQTRDGRALRFQDSPQLCGSCHGPTYEDWEAGAHGRISGCWDRPLGPITRQQCVNCHDPHAPSFRGRKPAPGPHPLRRPLDPPGRPNAS